MADDEIERSEALPDFDPIPIIEAVKNLAGLFEKFGNDFALAMAELAGATTPVRRVTSERVNE